MVLTTKYSEKEKKPKKDTWYGWLEEAIENNSKMLDYIQMIDDIPVEKAIVTEAEIYEGPTVKVDRAIPIAFSVSEVVSYTNDPECLYRKTSFKIRPNLVKGYRTRKRI